MKVVPRLLSSLLVASLALLPGGVAWSGAAAGKDRSKATAKGLVKRAPLADGKAKRLAKAAVPAPQAAPAYTPVAQVSVPQAPAALVPLPAPPVRGDLPAVASAPALPAPSPAKRNPYLPGAVAVDTSSQVNPYLPSAPVASPMPLAMTKSLSSVPVAAKVEAVAAKVEPVIAKVEPVVAKVEPRTVAVAAPPTAIVAAAKVAPETVAEKTPPVPARDIASEQAWAKIAANAAVAPRQAIPVAPVAAHASGNPYLAYRVAYAPAAAPVAPLAAPTAADASGLINSLRNFLPEPHLPSPDIDVLPSITKVYPTGERPMYVLTFKCPTELVGITPPPTKALRWLITSGMEAVNSTNLLPFSMQQVCQ